MGSGGRFMKTVFGIVVLVGFVWLLLVGILEGTGGERKQTRRLMTGGVVEKVEYSDMINSMSKRRVPNGPDPIHNRRAGNSGQPPGQA